MSNHMFRIRHKLDPTYVEEDSSSKSQLQFANANIPHFLRLLASGQSRIPSSIQVLHDGSQLSAEALLKGDLDISRPILVKDSPESIGMTVFRPEGSVTVRHVADVIGHLYPVRVIDVKHQDELEGWTLGDLVNFFEDEDRIRKMALSKQQLTTSEMHPHKDEHKCEHEESIRRPMRKAAEKASDILLNGQNKPRALNQLSLEFSDTPLRKLIESPQFVRELDWIDQAWPRELRKDKNTYPAVQYYCLTSTSGCFTEFHVDFGGTTVWYHVLSGAKSFCLIKPTPQNLEIYETWLKHPKQETLFLPNMIPNEKDVMTVNLQPSQTLLIPTAWIHAVFTPSDSVVIGGNFLHGLDLPLQLEATAIEDRTHVPDKFRFPYFRNLHFYVADMYLTRLRNNEYISKRELDNLPCLLKALEEWNMEQSDNSIQNKGMKEAAMHVATKNGCAAVDGFVQMLRDEHEKALHAGYNPNRSTNPFLKPGLSIKPVSSSMLSGSHITAPSPKSPRIRLKMGQPSSRNPTNSTKETNNEDGAFRIVISQVSKELHKPLPTSAVTAKKKDTREDTEYVDSRQDDDDWMPSLSLKRKVGTAKSKKPTKTPKTFSAKRVTGTLPSKRSGTKAAVALPPKKPKTTARQRLLKKIR